MKKRFGLILDEDVYRDWRANAAKVGLPVGDWLTGQFEMEVLPMEEQAKKAIEPDNVKREPRGRLSKGLGEIPGDPKPTVQRDPYKEFKPAPKPGKK